MPPSVVAAPGAADLPKGGTAAPSRARSIGALLVLAIVWGGSIPATKLALQDFPPLTLTALRYLAAAPLFVLLLLGRKLPAPRALLAMAGLGALGIGVGQVCQTLGV